MERQEQTKAVCDFLNDFIPLKPMLQPFRQGCAADGAVQGANGNRIGARVADQKDFFATACDGGVQQIAFQHHKMLRK